MKGKSFVRIGNTLFLLSPAQDTPTFQYNCHQQFHLGPPDLIRQTYRKNSFVKTQFQSEFPFPNTFSLYSLFNFTLKIVCYHCFCQTVAFINNYFRDHTFLQLNLNKQNHGFYMAASNHDIFLAMQFCSVLAKPKIEAKLSSICQYNRPEKAIWLQQ